MPDFVLIVVYVTVHETALEIFTIFIRTLFPVRL